MSINYSDYAPYDWEPLGGTSRRYLNTITGETISRIAYDRYYGALRNSGFNHYDQRSIAVRGIEPQIYDKAKTIHFTHYLGTFSTTEQLEKRISYVLSQISHGNEPYGMSLFIRVPGRKLGTTVIEYGNIRKLIESLETFLQQYGVDEEEEDNPVYGAWLTIYGRI